MSGTRPSPVRKIRSTPARTPTWQPERSLHRSSAKMVPMKHALLVSFSAILLALPMAAQVKLTPAPGKVSVEIDGKPFTDFYMSGEAFKAQVTKPYLWPLRAPSGTYITRSWPMEEVAEEATEKKPSRNGPPRSEEHTSELQSRQ